jgi:ribosomal subunit interface protein
MDASEALRSHILDHARRLERFAGDIVACDVVVEKAEERHHQGNRFNVRASLAMRGRKIDAGHTPTADHRHEDPYVAVADTFDALRRRVEDYVRRRRGDVKTRAPT